MRPPPPPANTYHFHRFSTLRWLVYWRGVTKSVCEGLQTLYRKNQTTKYL